MRQCSGFQDSASDGKCFPISALSTRAHASSWRWHTRMNRLTTRDRRMYQCCIVSFHDITDGHTTRGFFARSITCNLVVGHTSCIATTGRTLMASATIRPLSDLGRDCRRWSWPVRRCVVYRPAIIYPLYPVDPLGDCPAKTGYKTVIGSISSGSSNSIPVHLATSTKYPAHDQTHYRLHRRRDLGFCIADTGEDLQSYPPC